jgi:hypothetical protein
MVRNLLYFNRERSGRTTRVRLRMDSLYMITTDGFAQSAKFPAKSSGLARRASTSIRRADGLDFRPRPKDKSATALAALRLRKQTISRRGNRPLDEVIHGGG